MTAFADLFFVTIGRTKGVPGAGHLLLVDRPDIVAPVIEEFPARP